MKLSEEMAVRLHRMMWSDMHSELGDNPSENDRLAFKRMWIKRNFPSESITNDCWLCEYASSVANPNCKYCPISWPMGHCNTPRFSYLTSPISEILALPARNEKLTGLEAEDLANNKETAAKWYYQYREVLLSKASGLPASSAIDDHVKRIQEKAQDAWLKAAKNELSVNSGLDVDATLWEHIRAIKEKAVEEYFKKTPGAKLATMDVDRAFKQYAKEQKEPIFRALAEESGLDPTATVKAHIDAIYSNGRDDGKDEEREHILDKIGEMLKK